MTEPSDSLGNQPGGSKRFTAKLNDPFVIFCFAGLVAFIGSLFYSDQSNDLEIIVTESDIHRIEQQWRLEQSRQPTTLELEGLVDAYVEEEIVVREALSLGLDFNDTIIRRRLVQKYRFIHEEDELDEPTSELELKQFYQANLNLYRRPQTVSFKHIYFESTNPKGSSEEVEALIPTLSRSNWFDVGDPFPSSRDYVNVSHQQIVSQFGNRFLTAIRDLPVQSWYGPIDSTYGKHVVLIERREPSSVSSFDTVKRRVALDYDAGKREENYRRHMDGLRGKYRVNIETKATISD